MPDAGDNAIGGRHHKAVADRGHPLRITEEIGAPQSGEQAKPAQRAPQPMQQHRANGKGRNENIALRMDRRDLAANGLQHIHQGNLTLMAMILRASFDINLVKSHEANGYLKMRKIVLVLLNIIVFSYPRQRAGA